jgi:hypothetical protein
MWNTEHLGDYDYFYLNVLLFEDIFYYNIYFTN